MNPPVSAARQFSRLAAALLLAAGLRAEPLRFNLPAQPAAEALIAFGKQTGIDVIFPADELSRVRTPALQGEHEPVEALQRLLRDTGFTVRRNGGGKYVVTAARRPTGTVRGRLLAPDGSGAAGAEVVLLRTREKTVAGPGGEFEFSSVPPGTHQLVAGAAGWQQLRLDGVVVAANELTEVAPQKFQAEELARLEPIVVEARSARMKLLDDSASLLGPRRATGNLDLLRTENDALPFAVLTREQITRSGVVSLNDFLQRAVLEGDTSPTPEQSLGSAGPVAGSRNLNLRSYGATETVVLINGRRLPEILTSDSEVQPPDVNFIPLNLVQQVEVLPLSASALYSGSPVGGVINIVLRPDVTATEVTATYTNALGGFDAPQSSLSLQHGQSLLDGALRVRLSANFSRAEPPTEAELGHRRRHDAARPVPEPNPHRATPHIRSADGSPLLAGSAAAFTSVAPGADGMGGLGAFAGRAGLRNPAFFDGPGGLAAAPTSLDSPYGRRERRAAWFGSVTYDPFPWLQLGVDVTTSRTVINRGHGVVAADLSMPAAAPLNPFGQDVELSLNEQATALGENYNETRIDFTSGVAGVLLRLPREWQASFDAQYAHNVVRFRGLAGADRDRWEALIAQGAYNPLRDTQVHAAPARFYDEVLVYRGGRGRFLETGDYQTLDAAARLVNRALPLPTGRGVLQLGADYRWQKLAAFQDEFRYGDGSVAVDADARSGRTLERYSFFTELRGPIWPRERLPRLLREVEADVAVRYVASALAREANLAPTFSVKAAFAGGLSFRGSVSTSNRFPTPQLSKVVVAPGGPDIGINREEIFDPRRNETYETRSDELLNPALSAEEAVTQTAGLIFERGERHRIRAALDFVDTRKTNELLMLDTQAMVNGEALFPGRVVRAAPASGDPQAVGRIVQVYPGSVNASWRHSQNWNAALDYAWADFAGGTLELRGRVVWFQSYERRVFANTPVVDQLREPDGTAPGLLRARGNLGASWAGRRVGFGAEGLYFHSRVLPPLERPGQGDKQIKPWWQFDAYVRADLGRWVPWKGPRTGLTAQLRVNNLLGTDFPRYAHDISAAGLRAYGDWRGRTYSLSVTAAF